MNPGDFTDPFDAASDDNRNRRFIAWLPSQEGRRPVQPEGTPHGSCVSTSTRAQHVQPGPTS